MDESAVEALLFGASKLRELQVDSGYEIYEQSRELFGELLTAHMFAVGTIATVMSQKEILGTEVGGDLQQQTALISSFIQGVNIVDSSISEGHYNQAAALIRQELETISALEDLNQGRAVSEASKPVRVPRSLVKLYDDLSDIEETAVQNMLETILAPDSTGLQNSTSGLVMVQKFNEQRSWRLFGLHVSLLIVLAVNINEYYVAIDGKGLDEIELQALMNAQKILLSCGWLTQKA